MNTNTLPITYTASKGKKPINWFKTLNSLIHDDSNLTDKQFLAFVNLSKSWVTCACGTQCSILPRYRDGTPCDLLLNELGLKFYADITNRAWTRALKTLSKIEKRSCFLLKQMKSA
jgi:hypothetical protein